MELKKYQIAAKRTCPELGFIDDTSFNQKFNLAHMALGMASELSELEECLVALTFDKVNLKEELGDCLWYAVNWATFVGIELDENRINIALIDEEGVSALMIYGGQLADIAKRLLAYNASLDSQETKRSKSNQDNYLTNERILYNYLSAIYDVADVHNLDIEEIMGRNITKLYVRYKEKFSEDSALCRDLDAEREALEN